jgi:hypothetical protein
VRDYRVHAQLHEAAGRLLAEICQTELQDNGSFLSFTNEGLQVRLVKGKRSRMTFMYRKTVKVALFYNRRFPRGRRTI